MPHPENVVGKGRKFTSEEQPTKKGRKPKLLTPFLKEVDFSSKDMGKLVVNLLAYTSMADYKRLRAEWKRNGGEKQSLIVDLILKILQQSADKGEYKPLFELLSYAGIYPPKEESFGDDSFLQDRLINEFGKVLEMNDDDTEHS
jgi:hypothetical protein